MQVTLLLTWGNIIIWAILFADSKSDAVNESDAIGV